MLSLCLILVMVAIIRFWRKAKSKEARLLIFFFFIFIWMMALIFDILLLHHISTEDDLKKQLAEYQSENQKIEIEIEVLQQELIKDLANSEQKDAEQKLELFLSSWHSLENQIDRNDEEIERLIIVIERLLIVKFIVYFGH